MSKRKNSSAKKGFQSLTGILMALIVILAFFKGTGATTPQQVIEVFQGQAPTVEQFIKNLTNGGDLIKWNPDSGKNNGSGNSNGSNGDNSSNVSAGAGVKPDMSAKNAKKALDGLKTQELKQDAPYNRGDWRHWDNITSCWNVRQEVLYRQAEPGTVTLLDKKKNVTKKKADACSVSGGTWVDPFTGKKFTNPSDLDIDHVIPLSYANKAGGYKWDSEAKRDYANDLSTGHLLAVSASANRQKGDKGPSDWKPQKSYQCNYAIHWVSISTSWKLTVPKADRAALVDMMKTC